jgi:putative 2-oxoglutarate-Fe(II)-dependent oxygenase superfamily protein
MLMGDAMDRFALFPTPLFVLPLPELAEVNSELTARLLAERQASPGLQRSNVGGWHSRPDLSQRPDACYRTLLQRIVGCVDGVVAELAAASGALPPGAPPPRFRYGIHGWAMILGPADYVVLHDHGEAHWSTVYYVDAGDDTGDATAGRLAFVAPGRGGRPVPGLELFPTTFTIRPRTGSLVVFPGWLQHYVHPYRGSRPRISISCNLVLDAGAPPAGP